MRVVSDEALEHAKAIDHDDKRVGMIQAVVSADAKTFNAYVQAANATAPLLNRIPEVEEKRLAEEKIVDDLVHRTGDDLAATARALGGEPEEERPPTAGKEKGKKGK